MAIVLEANYKKLLGLPNYSSHAYSITVRTEVSSLSKIEEASAHLYRQLQDAVDRDIQERDGGGSRKLRIVSRRTNTSSAACGFRVILLAKVEVA